MAMPKSGDLAIGIMMVLTGLYILVWLPALKRRLTKRQEAGERTVEEVRRELKNMKVVMLSSFVVGAGLICIYAFKLYD